MRTMHHNRNLLARETAHMVGGARLQLAAMLRDAVAFAEANPSLSGPLAVAAIALKLLTLHEGSERWVRQLVACAAIEIAAGGDHARALAA